MPTFTPTKDRGATTKASPVLYAEDACVVDDAMLEEQVNIPGVDVAFVADLLSACLAHERCGVHLYRSCAARTMDPELRKAYEDFGAETARHVAILEAIITESRGNPNYVSPRARAVEATDTKLLESTFLAAGGLDVADREMAMLEAVLIAETIDHANWETMRRLGEAMPAGPERDGLSAAVGEVLVEEDKHLGWAAETRGKLIMTSALEAQPG
jgi:rubrerythrin